MNNKKVNGMKIAIGSDHGGFEVKEEIKTWLSSQGAVVEDTGTEEKTSVDYTDFATDVARRVSDGRADQGVLVCTTGIGMSIAANKFPNVRAALCHTPETARSAKEHNNANVLALAGGSISGADAQNIVGEWLNADFDQGGRHERRVNKIDDLDFDTMGLGELKRTDPEIFKTMKGEVQRQIENIELIASENYASKSVREAMGSVMTNKYAEGYPGKRWYNGCERVDAAEQLAIDRAKELFGAEHANVQPHSGSGANMSVYFSVLDPGDTILAMNLAHGGHLTHGHPMNFSGRFFNIVEYGVKQDTEMIDYVEIAKLAEEHRPKIIVAGASAYPRIIDFKRMRKIADNVGALLMADMAHIAGLVAAGCHSNPVPHCEFVTSTTHKTLRGPRGGLVLCREAFAKDLDKQIFPGIQGGPLMHTIAAKAVCFHEALQPAFKKYALQVVQNAQVLAGELEKQGLRLVSGGTDNHMMLVDLSPKELTGKAVAAALDLASITVNKNAIPFDTKSPFVTSGVRIGTPAVTSRGMTENDMLTIGGFIGSVLKNVEDEKALAKIREQVISFTSQFPVP